MIEIRLRPSRAAQIAKSSLEQARRVGYVCVRTSEVIEQIALQCGDDVCFVREDCRRRVTFTPAEILIAIRDKIDVRPSCQ